MVSSLHPSMIACSVMMSRHSAPLLKTPYEVQLKMKEIRARNAIAQYVAKLRKRKLPQTDEFYAQLDKNGGIPCVIEPVRYNAERQYRNKSSSSVGFNPEGSISVGHSFRYRHVANNVDTLFTMPIHDLPTTKQIHSDIFKKYHKFLLESQVIPRGNGKPWGKIIARSNEKNECMVHINFNPAEATEVQTQLAKEELLQKFLPSLQKSFNLKSLYWMLGQFEGMDISLCPSEKLWGDTHIEEKLLGKRFLISPRSFFQVNTAAAEILYKATAEQLHTANKNTLLLDVCCGTGTIGIIMSDYVSKVIGIDVCNSALSDAKLNAALNNAQNVEHVRSDAEDFLSKIVEDGSLNDYEHVIAVVNPHRTGLKTRLIRKLRQVPPLKQVVYLSCLAEGRPTFNFMQLSTTSTTRRLGKPFMLKNVVPLDPFPYTKYVEMVLNFER